MSVRWVRQALTALLVLAAGALLFADIFSGRAQQAAAPVAATPVAPKHFTVQALKPIARGSVIGRGEIELKQAPNAPAPGTYTSIAEAADRMATRNIAKSEALSDANTSVAVKGVGLSELIPPGLRAVALKVSDETAVANFIRPGDRVDVLLLSNAARAPVTGGRLFPNAEALTILQNIPVLAVNEVTVAGGQNAPVIRNLTLAVTPKQAAMIAMVRSIGSEYLSLRATSDDVEVALSAITTDDFQPAKAEESRPAPRPAPRQVSRPAERAVEIIAGRSDNVSRVAVPVTR